MRRLAVLLAVLVLVAPASALAFHDDGDGGGSCTYYEGAWRCNP